MALAQLDALVHTVNNNLLEMVERVLAHASVDMTQLDEDIVNRQARGGGGDGGGRWTGLSIGSLVDRTVKLLLRRKSNGCGRVS